MPIIEIALSNPDRTPMWNIPGTKLFLSYESPGPLSVETDSLSTEHKRILAQDLSRRVLVGKNTDSLFQPEVLQIESKQIQGGGSLAKSYSNVRTLRVARDQDEGYLLVDKNKEVKPTIVETKVTEVDLTDMIEQREVSLKNLLNQHVATVKKDIPGKTLSELRILRDIESQYKKRPSVIKLLDQLISKAQAQVFESIQNSYDTKASLIIPKDLPVQYLDNVTSVVESEYQEVTIKLGTNEE